MFFLVPSIGTSIGETNYNAMLHIHLRYTCDDLVTKCIVAVSGFVSCPYYKLSDSLSLSLSPSPSPHLYLSACTFLQGLSTCLIIDLYRYNNEGSERQSNCSWLYSPVEVTNIYYRGKP